MTPVTSDPPNSQPAKPGISVLTHLIDLPLPRGLRAAATTFNSIVLPGPSLRVSQQSLARLGAENHTVWQITVCCQYMGYSRASSLTDCEHSLRHHRPDQTAAGIGWASSENGHRVSTSGHLYGSCAPTSGPHYGSGIQTLSSSFSRAPPSHSSDIRPGPSPWTCGTSCTSGGVHAANCRLCQWQPA